MSNVTPAKTLEERVTERLHESIGDLITEADLKDMVSRGIEKALFEDRIFYITRGYGGGGTYPEKKTPLVDELVDKHLSSKMKAAVEDWIKENPEQLQVALDAAIQRGVADALMRTMDERMGYIFTSAAQSMKAQGLLP